MHATIRTDTAGQVTDWDDGAEQLFGHPSGAMAIYSDGGSTGLRPFSGPAAG